MNSPEEYESIISLLKTTLKFYADEHNYLGFPSSIDHDEHGYQARFVLAKVEEFEETMRKAQEEYDKFIAAGEMIQASEEPIDPQKLIEHFKVFGNND